MLEKIASIVQTVSNLYENMLAFDLENEIGHIFNYAQALIELKTTIDLCQFSEDEIKNAIAEKCYDLEPDIQIMVYEYLKYH